MGVGQDTASASHVDRLAIIAQTSAGLPPTRNGNGRFEWDYMNRKNVWGCEFEKRRQIISRENFILHVADNIVTNYLNLVT